ncbi:MAG: GNAT family N-acetyltransferase [Gemmatimonadaceae bacterium]|nr:GNAT family N-acetyltransferase [Gemmatimonadaceae bacterium]
MMSSATVKHVVHLRQASDADLESVSRLLMESNLPTAGVADCIADFVVAEKGDEVIGAIGLETHGQFGLLRSAVVAPGWQGRGVGRSLVKRLVADAALHGLDALYLLTTTAEGYFPAFGFERTDWQSVPAELMASPEFKGACPDSAVVMRLELQRPNGA